MGRSVGSEALLEKARALEQSGDFRAVVRLLEPLDRRSLLEEPDLGYGLAYALRRVGRTSDALELVVALTAPVDRRADPGLSRRRLSLEAMLRYDLGQLSEAEGRWERLAAESELAADHALTAAAQNNLGVIRTLHDRIHEATAAYGRALLAFRRRGDRRGLAQTHHNLAILFREQGLLDQAEDQFRHAAAHARASDSQDVLGRIEEERALLFLERDDAALAAAAATRSLRRLAAIGDLAGEGEALRVLGLAALRAGDTGTAASCLGRALERARESGNRLLEAETLEAIALTERGGAGGKAAVHRRAADAIFEAIGATAWGGRIRRRTAQLAGL